MYNSSSLSTTVCWFEEAGGSDVKAAQGTLLTADEAWAAVGWAGAAESWKRETTGWVANCQGHPLQGECCINWSILTSIFLRLQISKRRHWKYQLSSVVDFIFAYHCSLQGNQPMPNWCVRCESCSRRFSILSNRGKPLSPALTMRRCSRWRWAVAYRLPFVYDSRSAETPSTVKHLTSFIFYQ